MPSIHFRDITAPAPTEDDLRQRAAELSSAYDAAQTTDERREVVERWDRWRREVYTWRWLTHLRFEQDTRNAEYKRARDESDALWPTFTELEIAMKRKLVEGPHQEELQQWFGPAAPARYAADVLTFDPAIADDLVAESKLEAEYTELLASAKLDFRGEAYNLSEIAKFAQDADRQLRHDSLQVTWNWFAEHGPRIDAIYESLVRLRQQMAAKLGFENYIPLAYRKMNRIDYAQGDVETFRAEVLEHVVPLARKLHDRQAENLGVEKLMFWDEQVHDPQGSPKPQGDHDWMLQRATEMFDEMGELGPFFRLMNEGGFLDLKTRQGKAGGGFCIDFPSYGMPFIFANFNGTRGDVEVFTHEMGHAYQVYQSREQPLVEYLLPTYEACEIHSMGLEFLTWPHMDKFFGNHAERFRRVHLTTSLAMIPYIVAVDHFQHLIYERPDAAPEERHHMWQEMERTYLPWRDYGDLDYPARGGRWQLQRHLFFAPFYYIDYALAETCALQIWRRAEADRDDAMNAYHALCRRGGEAPFGQLVEGAGLISPFQPGCLAEVARVAGQRLGV